MKNFFFGTLSTLTAIAFAAPWVFSLAIAPMVWLMTGMNIYPENMRQEYAPLYCTLIFGVWSGICLTFLSLFEDLRRN